MNNIKAVITKENIPYAILALFLMVSLVGIFGMQRKSNENKQKIVEQFETSQSAKQDNSLEYYQKLLDEKRPLSCAFRTELPGATIIGSLQMDLANNRIRTDIDAPDKQGKQRLSHTIYDSDNIYLWYEGDDAGMKLNKQTYGAKLQELKEKYGEESGNNLSFFAVMASLEGSDFIDQPNIKCSEWQVDNFLFTLPPNVTFVDAVSFYEGLDKIVCDKCDEESTEASRLLCRKTLKCK